MSGYFIKYAILENDITDKNNICRTDLNTLYPNIYIHYTEPQFILGTLENLNFQVA